MGKAGVFTAARVRELEDSVDERWSREAFLRFQCVWLRHALALSAPEIARALCISVSTVRRIHAEFIKTGRPAIEGKGNRGGRRRGLMTLTEEAAFLREHGRRSKDGKIRNVTELKREYEIRVGRTVHKTTIYRLLDRHGWRKVSPRTFHTKRNPAQTAALKKTPR
jgi:transposase